MGYPSTGILAKPSYRTAGTTHMLTTLSIARRQDNHSGQKPAVEAVSSPALHEGRSENLDFLACLL